ncbi:MAG: M23 family metallopeptidase [Oscillospiraceae bacterium]|nr:M23 family metallopeptidase [Oscillospiraceae bacterium]
MNRTDAARRRAQQLRRRTRGRSGAAGDSPGMGRLVICGVIFVLVVAAKLLFPEAVDGLAQSAGRLIGQNADFQEAFAAMGRAISGEGSLGESLQEAYTAVFNPAPQPDAPAAPEPAPKLEPDGAPEAQTSKPGSRLVGYLSPALPDMETPAITETVIEPEELDDGTGTDSLSYVYTMPTPPENASLAQRNLGFDHSSPVQGVLSSSFGWREHPVEGGSKFHYGVDLAADEGTDVTAFADGTVYATGESSTLGNYIMLRHQGGYITLYGHCSRITATGGSVAMGEKIAEVGSTGRTTGPHLHFELHDGELYLNPIFYVEIG